ncbi:MAG: signal peptidase I [Candidatus Aenigmatarchaeota archaeon]
MKPKNKKQKYIHEIFEFIVAFVIAWLFYQGLVFAFGTEMPIVSVVSQSMYHDKQFDIWWDEHGEFYEKLNITKEEFLKFPMPNGFSRGDLLFVVNGDPSIGDIILYNKNSITIVHRVIKITKDGYLTKGDNNFVADTPIKRDQVVGKVIFGVPILGYPRLALYALGI